MNGVVVVGTGFGCYTHVRALRAAGFDVRAVVGRDPVKTEARARMFDVPIPPHAPLDRTTFLSGGITRGTNSCFSPERMSPITECSTIE